VKLHRSDRHPSDVRRGPEIGERTSEMVVKRPALIDIVANYSLQFEPMKMLQDLFLTIVG
jgi:hypothetical protein